MNNMKWKYRNNTIDETENQNYQPIFITSQASGPEYVNTMGNIRVVENKIFFYGEITDESMLELNKILVEMDIKVQNTKNILGNDYDPIVHLHMNTYGGSVFAAFSTVDIIRNLRSKVYTYVDGNVASAGTLITSIGNKRYIGKHAHMLIHQLSSGVYGKFSEIEDEMFNLNNLMKLLKKFYKENTKIPMKKLDDILKKDIWMDADECIVMGIVDQII